MPEASGQLINHDAGLSAGSRNPKIGEDWLELFFLCFFPFSFFFFSLTGGGDFCKAALVLSRGS